MKTDRGARDSSMVYSIIQTVLANNLKVYEYLVYLLKQMPNTDLNQIMEVLIQDPLSSLRELKELLGQ